MTRFKSGVLAAAFAAGVGATAALAEPAIVYSVGGKFDGSFNESAYAGVKRVQEETGVSVREFELERDAQSLQALRNFAGRGYTPVVAIGFNQANALDQVAPEFPNTDFAIVDMVVDQPNVRSYVFKEQEGAYIGGLLGAMASESGTIGFVGGMDIPIIHRFLCGYKQGALAADPGIKVLYNMAGDTPAAFTDPARGAELATSQIQQGADVVIQAAGGTGLGVLQAASDAGVLGIGTDSNQNGIHPGKVLTSIRKRVDNAVYDSFQSARNGSFEPGVQVLGLAEGGMDWVLDDNNRDLITPEMKAAADAAVKGISDGTISVHDVVADGPCPF
ncbi:BMP family lipoprotein [Roseibium salinum]|uniref:BMP family ABC transporter substrate-binding protein n=1 Tax=Roseibium salinum TaxID=1604349 RepID=A0ABT3R4P8_9HYPH|nr:BMP family ABC transporter substrate-binding protein [Roseibium sp. DSM 29163]MCX2724168.1 BMP family ABC transporter substrate-binding protein [Roseibium sp. DSM 29163]MDN3721772.1 BMP family ABC transporter substrate-binding protein [Roseibium salinum]